MQSDVNASPLPRPSLLSIAGYLPKPGPTLPWWERLIAPSRPSNRLFRLEHLPDATGVAFKEIGSYGNGITSSAIRQDGLALSVGPSRSIVVGRFDERGSPGYLDEYAPRQPSPPWRPREPAWKPHIPAYTVAFPKFANTLLVSEKHKIKLLPCSRDGEIGAVRDTLSFDGYVKSISPSEIPNLFLVGYDKESSAVTLRDGAIALPRTSSHTCLVRAVSDSTLQMVGDLDMVGRPASVCSAVDGKTSWCLTTGQNIYSINSTEGTATPIGKVSWWNKQLTTIPGTNHVALLSSTDIAIVKPSRVDGAFDTLQTVSIVPEGVKNTSGLQEVAMKVTSDGRMIFAVTMLGAGKGYLAMLKLEPHGIVDVDCSRQLYIPSHPTTLELAEDNSMLCLGTGEGKVFLIKAL